MNLKKEQEVMNFNMKKQPTMMRCPKELLEDLKELKIASRESYADVVKKLIDEKRRKR